MNFNKIRIGADDSGGWDEIITLEGVDGDGEGGGGGDIVEMLDSGDVFKAEVGL